MNDISLIKINFLINNFEKCNNNIINDKSFDYLISYFYSIRSKILCDSDFNIYFTNSGILKEIKILFNLYFNYSIQNYINSDIKKIKDINIMKINNLNQKYFLLKITNSQNKEDFIKLDSIQLEYFIEKIKLCILI